MAAIIILILLGIVVAGGFLVAFIWAVKSGQYDDDYSPSVRMLFDNLPEKADDESKVGESGHESDRVTGTARDKTGESV